MIKKYLAGAIVAAAAFLGATSAQASTTFWFTSGNGNHVGNTYEFSKDGVDVTATPFANNYFGSATLNQYGSGLTVSSSDCYYGYCGDSNHEIDGKYWGEGVSFEFSTEVLVEKIYFSYVGYNDDFSFRADGGAYTTEDIDGGNYWDDANGSYVFDLPGLLGTTIDIAALFDDDDFKIRGMKVSVSAVPLPPAVLMFGAALIGLGWVKRRKQAA